MSAWSGSVAECPYTRITKSWPTFSSRLIRAMSRLRRLSVEAAEAAACALPGRATTPVAAAAAAAAVAVRRVRLEVRWCT